MNLAFNPFAAFLELHRFRPANRQPTAPVSWTIPAAQGARSIDKGATLVVPQAAGTIVTCSRGCLWITHDGDVKDIVISAGESYRSARASRMLVYGLEASSALLD